MINSISSSNPGAWILLHDMLPRDWTEHHTPIVSTGAWTGDVWKVAFELVQATGIDFRLIKIDHGVGVFRVLDNRATLPDLRAELANEEFSYYCDNLHHLPIASWDEALPWLRT